MAYNLFIAYDLMSPGQSYDAVRDAIKGLGQWHQFQFSLFYVSTQYSPGEAFAIVNAVMDVGDGFDIWHLDFDAKHRRAATA